jgi:imidazoleglycerol phosphate dehydratase HisB
MSTNSPNSKKKTTTKEEKPRSVEKSRDTKETKVSLQLNLDGTGQSDISTNIAFLDHMLELFAKHASIDLTLNAEGDLDHHITEDIGITLGSAIVEALGEKKGIRRYGDKLIPMDESLAECSVDLGGRGYHHINLQFKPGTIEDVDSENLVHFFETLAINAKMNLHITVKYGENEHHKAEAAFKAFARAFREAIEIIDDTIPSTKGII